jgi:sec-independent protein translocase protein TatB
VFNLSGSEVVFLLLAGLVVLGPERLPGVIRRVGKTYGEPLDEIRGAVKGLSDEVNKATSSGKWFGEVDDEPSPPMRPERSAAPHEPEVSGSETPQDERPGGDS